MLRALGHAEGHVESLGTMDMGHDNMMVSRREGGLTTEGREGRDGGHTASRAAPRTRTYTQRPHRGHVKKEELRVRGRFDIALRA